MGLLEYIKIYGGATLLDGAPVEMCEGFGVSVCDGFKCDLSVEAINKAIQEGYNGFWFDGGFLYCDKSIIIKDKAEALKIARNNNQLAIYDFKKKISIFC